VRVALTYDLRDDYRALGFADEELAEFDFVGTIDAIDAALRALGHETERVGNVRALARRLADGERWDLVFNTAEGVRGFGREAQVPALLEAFELAYTFSDPLVCALTLHKGMAKHVLASAGVPTPRFHVVASDADLAEVALPYPLFVKPVAEGTAKGIDAASRVEDAAALAARCRHVWARYAQPALVEPFLPGREFTVGVLGERAGARAIGTLELKLRAAAEPDVYSYLNKEQSEERVDLPLADAAAAALVEPVALAAWRALGGRDAGRIDLRLDAAGRPQVLELNPLPGLHPTHSDLPILWSALGHDYRVLIGAIVESAATRRPAAAGSGRGAAHPPATREPKARTREPKARGAAPS
jgi:D-alanine-D-alanine ligase